MNEDQIIKAINAYSIELYGKLKELGGNLFFSPFSIFTTLLMVLEGACGLTEVQLKDALHIISEQTSLRDGFKDLMKIFQRKGGSELYSANLMCTQETYPPLDEYLSILENIYKGELWCLDFSDDKGICDKINSWVSKQTRGKIKQTINRIDPATIFILLNAIYFKGKWFHQFDEGNTFIDPFTLISGKEVMVNMMYQRRKFRYLDKKGYKVIEMFYEGSKSTPEEISMVIFLPKEKDGLIELEDKLDIEKLDDDLLKLQNTRMREVKVYFPRFKIETSYNLIQPHQELGITEAFNVNADLSRIVEDVLIFINEFIHKAIIDVTEEGVEAAALTMIAAPTGYPPPSKSFEFRADHPFLYLIIDSQKRTILFFGRLMEPEGSLPPKRAIPNRPLSLRETMIKEADRLRKFFKK